MKSITSLALFAILIPTGSVFAVDNADSRRYTVSIGGKTVGTRTVTRLDEHHWKYHFEFSDRGRGPDIVTLLETDEDGLPVSVAVTGKSYFKGEVDESLDIRDGRYQWQNQNESGSSGERGFYIPLNDGMGAEPLLRALLADDDSQLPLLPSGNARAIEQRRHVLEQNGETLALTLYAIEGLGFSPQYVWATDDHEVFHDGWVIRRGWEEHADTLDALADEVEQERFAHLADDLPVSNGPLLVTNARLFDPVTGKLADGMHLLVENGRIIGATTDMESLNLPEAVERMDADGRFLMPGLYDMHVHNFGGDGVGLQHLAGGVTTVRDLASPIDDLVSLRKRWQEGTTLGPRVHMGGFMDGPGKYAGPSKILVDTREEALDAVDQYARLGYRQVKLYNSIPHELVPLIIERAHEHNMKVSGHIPVHVFAEEAVEMGYDEIQHINHLFLNFMDRDIDNRTPARFTEVAGHGTDVEMRSESVQALIALLREHDTVIDPTLAIFESSWVSRPGDILPPRVPVADRLPPMVLRQSLWSGLPVPEGMDEQYKASFRRAQEFVKTLHESGVRIVAGTDFMPGFALHRELELYADAGISNADVLRIATYGAAEVMDEADNHGRIAPGYAADLILIDGNPLDDMSNIRNVSHVIRAGKLYRVRDLQEALGMTLQ